MIHAYLNTSDMPFRHWWHGDMNGPEVMNTFNRGFPRADNAFTRLFNKDD